MNIYCIKTHSQRAVIKGNIYTVVSDRCPCRCNAVDVGSPVPDEFMYYEDGRKGGYVVKANDYITDDENNIIEVICTYDTLSKSGMTLDRKIKGTIHWVSIEHGVNVEIRDYDRLFNLSNPNDLDNFIDGINPNSMSINSNAIIEPYVKEYNGIAPIQMIRKGYYILDYRSDKFVFNKSVSLRESYK